MGTKTYRPMRDDRIPDSAEVLDGKINQVVKYRLLPQIAVRNRIAVQGQGIPVYFFAKKKRGRRCSCFNLGTSPKQTCLCCFQTGIVGGYDKFGTELEILDITHPNLISVNVFPVFTESSHPPTKVGLIEGAIFGYLEGTMQLVPNVGKIDELFYDDILTEGGSIRYLIKTAADTDWIDVTEKAVTSRLGANKLHWRIEIRRSNLSVKSPQFGLIFLRYQTRQRMDILCDVPKTKRSRILETSGEADEWERQEFWLPDTLREVNPGDFFITYDGFTRWKIYDVQETAPNDFLTSWDVSTRMIQYWESTGLVPSGRLSVKETEEIKYNDSIYQRIGKTVGH